MGNTSSNPQSPNPRLDLPARSSNSPARGGNPTPSASSHRVHRSLRNKKKSLELPDLESLTLTSASPASSSTTAASASAPEGPAANGSALPTKGSATETSDSFTKLCQDVSGPKASPRAKFLADSFMKCVQSVEQVDVQPF